MQIGLLFLSALTMACLSRAAAAEPRAARSVHLWYPAPAGVAFYNEVQIEQSTPGSYFMACGFKHGYFGIQERSGDKVVLFSVWDPTRGDDPKRVPDEQRVEVLFHAPDVLVKRFGGEGTGGQSFFKYPWKTGETCRFLVRAEAADGKSTYAAFFRADGVPEWKHLATFRTRTGGDLLKDLYSFVEDFRRDGKSVQEVRRAVYRNAWLKPADGDWIALRKVRFTADGTPLTNIDAGAVGDGFHLTTGGGTKNTVPLKSSIEREHSAPVPADLAEVLKRPLAP